MRLKVTCFATHTGKNYLDGNAVPSTAARAGMGLNGVIGRTTTVQMRQINYTLCSKEEWKTTIRRLWRFCLNKELK